MKKEDKKASKKKEMAKKMTKGHVEDEFEGDKKIEDEKTKIRKNSNQGWEN